MTFNSVHYFLLLGFVIAAYWRLPLRPQNVLLLVTSYVFYGAWDWRFLSLIWISTIIDYTVARGLDAIDVDARRKRLLAVSMVGNLGILGFFKYFDFFTDSFHGLLEGLGLGALAPTVDIALPVGISFYTFQTMSYTIDVYRRRMSAERDLLNFAVFVAFFPQLVAGPIERATHLVPQIGRVRARPERSDVESALALILLGLFKKVVIADLAAAQANIAFDDAGQQSWYSLVIGVYLFALQIYGDFSGYSDIARGSSRLMGIELMQNFEQPYLSTDITAFWRTWHVSLSSWLRDYLYIPLGGNRRGPTRTEVNLLLTMLLGGLWHGAAWTFVVWGALNGVYLAAHKRFGTPGRRGDTPAFTIRDLPSAFATFNLVCLTWVFLRARSLGDAWDFLWGIVTLRSGEFDTNALGLLLMCGAAVVAIDVWQRNTRTHTPVLRLPALPQGVAAGVAVTSIVAFSGGVAVPFIYFQF